MWKFIVFVTLINVVASRNTWPNVNTVIQTSHGLRYTTGHLLAYQVAVIINKSTPCTGSIISPNAVITTARCIDSKIPAKITIRAGMNHIEKQTGKVFDVKELFTHPDYKEDENSNNIGIIIIKETWSKTIIYSIIRLVPPGYIHLTDTVGYVGGWLWSNNYCDGVRFSLKTYICNSARCEPDPDQYLIAPGFLNKGHFNEIKNCIDRNNGAPLQIEDYLAGVVSYHLDCTEDNRRPLVYVDIMPSVSWINKILDENKYAEV